MSKVSTYERFEDALTARTTRLTNPTEYQAGFMLSWIKGLAATYPEVEGQRVMMTNLLEQWNAEDEATRRAENAEVDYAD